MHNQRGFIGVGVLIAILVGLVVLGGGAYFVVQQQAPSQTASDNFDNVQTLPTTNNKTQQTQVSNTQSTPSATTPTPKNTSETTVKPKITNIKLLSSHSGQSYKAGDTITVRWEAPSELSSVVIVLGQSCTKGEVADGNCNTTDFFKEFGGISNTGEYKLKIPINAPSGNRYDIFVTDCYGMCLGKSYGSVRSARFSISASATFVMPKIIILSPQVGASLQGDTVTIKWRLDNPGNFELSDQNASLGMMGSTCPLTAPYGEGCLYFTNNASVSLAAGEYSWKILKISKDASELKYTGMVPGNVYNIRVDVGAMFSEFSSQSSQTQFSIRSD